MTFEQFQNKYFPVTYEKEKLSKMSPKELGRYHAKKILKEIAEVLRRKG